VGGGEQADAVGAGDRVAGRVGAGVGEPVVEDVRGDFSRNSSAESLSWTTSLVIDFGIGAPG
jgi:hypothetical protein